MIPVYCFPRGTNTVIQVDDPSVVTDEGAAMETPFFLTAPVDNGPAGGTSRMRHVAQVIILAGSTSVRLTPVVNGSEDPAQADTFALVTTDGPEQVVDAFQAVTGTRFQVKGEVTALAGACGFGEADITLIPKRSLARA